MVKVFDLYLRLNNLLYSLLIFLYEFVYRDLVKQIQSQADNLIKRHEEYDKNLKLNRIKELNKISSNNKTIFEFIEGDLVDNERLKEI